MSERDETLSIAVMMDDLEQIKHFAKRHRINTPSDDEDLKIYIYKGIQGCEGVSFEAKSKAKIALLKQGYLPKLIDPRTDLARCPFCGRTNSLSVHNYRCNKALWFYVKDVECGAQGPIAVSEEKAIKYWNDRE